MGIKSIEKMLKNDKYWHNQLENVFRKYKER